MADNVTDKSFPGVQGARVYKGDKSVINWADHMSRGTNQFNETKVAQTVTQFALNTNLPLSSFRDIQVGNITKEGSEYRIRADASNNTSILRTALRGNYISGHVLTPGMGVRIPTLPTGDQYAEWGYYEYDGNLDPNNGITFKRDSEGVSVNLYKNGVNQLGGGTGVRQGNWNVDPMDGTGPSGVDIDVPNGYVYRTPFVYYGYGPIVFTIGFRNAQGLYSEFPVHEADIEEGTSIEEPNLPLTLTSYNGGGSATFDAYVGGRQVSVSGPDESLEPRRVGWEVEERSVGESLTPLLTVQHKTGRENVLVVLNDFLFETDTDMFVYLYRNITLDDGSGYTTPTGYDPNETATEWNVDATSFSGGERFGGTNYIPVASTGNAQGAIGDQLPGSELIEGESWSVVARTVSSTANITGFFNVKELW